MHIPLFFFIWSENNTLITFKPVKNSQHLDLSLKYINKSSADQISFALRLASSGPFSDITPSFSKLSCQCTVEVDNGK